MVPREFGGSRRKRGGGGKRVVEEAWEFDVWGGGGFGVSVSESSEDASPYEAIRASILSFFLSLSTKTLLAFLAISELLFPTK